MPNTPYYFRADVSGYGGGVNIHFYDANKGYLGNVATYTNATFTTPQNAHFMRFVSWTYQAYGNDITVSLYYSGESGYDQYYPYTVLAEVDTGSEVLYGDGTPENSDSKVPDGTITRQRGRTTIDLTSLSYTQEESPKTMWYSTTKPFESICKLPASNAVRVNGKCNKLVFFSYNDLDSNVGIAITSTGRLAISDAVKTALSSYGSVTIEYPLATPTTEQGTPFAENIPCDDFGSLSWTQTKGIPQGNEIFYPVDYKASIDTLYNLVNGDMSKIVTEDEYPEAPSSDGTYVLKATVSGGTKTYAWVAE